MLKSEILLESLHQIRIGSGMVFYLNQFLFHYIVEVCVQAIFMYRIEKCRNELTTHFGKRVVFNSMFVIIIKMMKHALLRWLTTFAGRCAVLVRDLKWADSVST